MIVVALVSMAVEMAIGFAVTTALYRARNVALTDAAAELRR